MLTESFIASPKKISDICTVELNFLYYLFQVSKRMTIFLSIPETFIVGYGFTKPTLICTDSSTNELCFDENLHPSGINEGFVYFKEISKPNYPIAVYKAQNTNHDKCEPIFTVKECKRIWDNNIKANKCACIQRFVFTGKIPKIYKASYFIADNSNLVTLYKKNSDIQNNLFPGLRKQSTFNSFDTKFHLLKQKDQCTKHEISAEYSLNLQITALMRAIEKYYSSNKNCKVEIMETN